MVSELQIDCRAYLDILYVCTPPDSPLQMLHQVWKQFYVLQIRLWMRAPSTLRGKLGCALVIIVGVLSWCTCAGVPVQQSSCVWWWKKLKCEKMVNKSPQQIRMRIMTRGLDADCNQRGCYTNSVTQQVEECAASSHEAFIFIETYTCTRSASWCVSCTLDETLSWFGFSQ